MMYAIEELEGFELLTHISASITMAPKGYIASFAGVCVSGDTVSDAFTSLKSRLVEQYRHLSKKSVSELGYIPRKQLSELRAAMRPKRKWSRNHCQCCGEASVLYYSHPMTHMTDPGGREWGDVAICLCKECLVATSPFVYVSDYFDYVGSV